MKIDMEQITELFIAEIRSSPVSIISSPVPLISMGVRMIKSLNITDPAECKSVLLQVLERVAKGNDGMDGTADDLLSPDMMKQLRMLLDTSVAGDIITLAYGIGNHVVKKNGCFGCLI